MSIKVQSQQTLAVRNYSQIVASTLAPRITNVQVCDSSYNVLDDTSVSTSGGFIKLTGTGFKLGCVVYVGGTPAITTIYVSSTTLNCQIGAASANTQLVYLMNPDNNSAIYLNGIPFSGVPNWSTGTTLAQQTVGDQFSIQLTATSDSNITYSLQSGSTLPPGTTLSSSGVFAGTVTGLASDTTYSFTVVATDVELQDTARAFTVTVIASDLYFNLTTLLLNGETSSNYWIQDISTNSFAITVNGDTRPVGFSPYETVWSNFFDGTDDYLSITANSAFNLPGDFTMECWAYWIALPGNSMLLDTYVAGDNGSYQLYWRSTGSSIAFYTPGDGVILQDPSSSTIVVNKWYHIAVTRSGTTARLFIDGVQKASATLTRNLTHDNDFTVGIQKATLTNDINGYISNVRLIKGTALYTSNFTPSTSPLTAIANTSLLICQSNRLIDNSTNNFTITRNGDVSVSNFGPFVETDVTTGSGYFDGTGDNLSLTGVTAVGNSNATIEFFIFPTDSSVTYRSVFDSRSTTGTDTGFAIFQYGLTIEIYGNGLKASSSANALIINAWNHVALTRSSGTCQLYINGSTSGSSGTYSSNLTSTVIRIGDSVNTIYPYVGYISNLRVVIGSVVYSGSTYSVPTSPLTAITNTSLLTLQSRLGENNSRFVDTSGLNNIITRNGNATQGTFSPFSQTGWSNYFDGTLDSLTTPTNTNVAPTGNFTIECWIYANTLTSTNSLGVGISFIGNSTLNDGRLQFWVGTDGTISLYLRNNSAVDVTTTSSSSGTITTNTWYHIAAVRNVNTYTIYVNGTSVGTTTSATAMTYASNILNIGFMRQSNLLNYWNGYISNFRLINGTALYTSNFTIPTSPLTAITNTSLLTCQSNSFVDNSANNFAITRNGDTSVQSFSPFAPSITTPTSYSGYFDGTGDYLSFASAVVAATGDFTIEGWFNLTTTVGSRQDIFYQASPSTSVDGRLIINVDAAGTITAFVGGTTGAPGAITSSTVVTRNVWYHFAYVRNSNTFSLYINGVREGTQPTGTISVSQLPLIIGQNPVQSTFWFGYLSNIRVVNGTALYTSNFTVPTSPLTAITNTSLLTCQSSTFIDNSTNNFTITVNGDAIPRSFNPFGITTTTGSNSAYSVTTVGGSMYFDGTGDFLSIPNTSNLAPGTGNFTIECWVYHTSVIGNNNMYFAQGSNGVSMYRNTSGQLEVAQDSVAAVLNTTTTLPSFNWIHVLASRFGSTLRLFINGVQSASVSNSTNFSGSGAQYIGISGNGSSFPMNGYISNFRFIKGTALYTSGFVPPVVPVTPIAGTTLLLNGTNGGIIDYTSKNNLETVGNASTSTAVVKYGSRSLYFDGTGDYLLRPSSPNLDFGTGDFTIECWVYFNSLSTSRMILDRYASANGGSYQLYWRSTGTSITFWAGTGIILQDSNTSRVSTGQWYHIAVTRSGTTARLFVDGAQVATTTNSTNLTSTLPLCIGREFTSSSADLNGYIDDLRITKGVARYTSNFTPPTSQFITF